MNPRNPWDEVAEVYEEVRPGYPDQLIQDIIQRVGLSVGARLLEIGAGTGKATVSFAERGFRIRCVEPGLNLADILVRKCSCYPNVSVDVASFEEWTPDGDDKFDLVFSAQAFNYLDPETRYRKCHQLLKDDGYLALFWYGGEYDSWESDIISSGLFHQPEVFDYCSDAISDTEAYIKAMKSVSTFVTLDEGSKSRMREETRRDIEQQGGSVRLNYKMYLAKKI